MDFHFNNALHEWISYIELVLYIPSEGRIPFISANLVVVKEKIQKTRIISTLLNNSILKPFVI